MVNGEGVGLIVHPFWSLILVQWRNGSLTHWLFGSLAQRFTGFGYEGKVQVKWTLSGNDRRQLDP